MSTPIYCDLLSDDSLFYFLYHRTLSCFIETGFTLSMVAHYFTVISLAFLCLLILTWPLNHPSHRTRWLILTLLYFLSALGIFAPPLFI